MPRKYSLEEKRIALNCGEFWAIRPEFLQSMMAAPLCGQEKTPKAAGMDLEDIPLNACSVSEVVGDTGIIRIFGVIEQRASLFSAIFGGTAIEDLVEALNIFVADGNVKQIKLILDSPGGQIAGVQALSDAIYAARAVKPILAYVNSQACSAAYWLASAASRIVLSSATDILGSIGVVAMHQDISEKERQEGIKTTEIVAGKYKRQATPYLPLSEEGRKGLQSQVNYMYGIFVDQVSRNRGVPVEKVLSDMAEGRLFIGQQAVAAGLVDSIDGVLEGTKNMAMTPEEQKEMDRLKKENEDLKKERDESKKSQPSPAEEQTKKEDAKKQGAAEERARMLALDEITMPGFESVIATAKKEGKTAQEAALSVLKAQKERGISLKEIRADSHQVGAFTVDAADEATQRAILAAGIATAGKPVKQGV